MCWWTAVKRLGALRHPGSALAARQAPAGLPGGGWDGKRAGERVSPQRGALTAEVGQSLDLGDGVALEVYASDPKGVVLLLRWDNFRDLFPLGLGADSLASLQNDPALRQLSLLLLADQGAAVVCCLNGFDQAVGCNELSACAGYFANIPYGMEHYPMCPLDQNTCLLL